MKKNGLARQFALGRGDVLLLCISYAALTAAFATVKSGAAGFAGSLIGATALVYNARGRVLGQALTVVFAVFYGAVSWHAKYYGEMITYLGMTAPIALTSVIEWARHPFGSGAEVAVRRRLSPRQHFAVWGAGAAVTAALYPLLRAFGTAQLALSTLSVFTSWAASTLTMFRSPWYALWYAANDAVLIVLWAKALQSDPSCLTTLVCFAVFAVSDIYGLIAWHGMKRRQSEE